MNEFMNHLWPFMVIYVASQTYPKAHLRVSLSNRLTTFSHSFYVVTGKTVYKSGGIYFYYTLVTHSILVCYIKSDTY